MTFTSGLRERFYLLSLNFPGFEEVLKQALFALLTREHVLWYSKPGRAKSMVAREIFNMFEGAPTFIKQLTKDTLPEAIFGNILVEELMRDGREIHNLENGMADCEFAYLDEFFDASDFVLRALLNVLNEREFHSKDMGTIKTPLHTVIATTNFMRQREATEAVLDRLLCKAVIAGVDGIADSMRAGQTYLSFSGKALDIPRLQYGDLLSLAETVERPEDQGGIVISPGMRLLHVVLVMEFQRRRIEAAKARWHEQNPDAAEEPAFEELQVPDISPRTLVKLHDFSRAAAALNDRHTVMKGDQRALGYGLIVIGDESGDEKIWHELCDEFLRLGSKELNSLEELGELADGVGQIKAERGQTTRAQLRIGGQMVAATSLSLRNVIDKITRNRHPVLSFARTELETEIRELDQPRTLGINLLGGWQ